MSYIYITEDNTINKQKYNYSQYNGKTFLLEYLATRENFIARYPANNIDESNISAENMDAAFSMILKLYYKFLDGPLCGQDLACFRKLVKSFEVRKLIYSKYSADWKIPDNASYDNYESYLVFGLCLAEQYEHTKCTKYLSCLLKLDDTLLSIQSKLSIGQRRCLSEILLKELAFVRDLAEQMGIEGV